MIAPRRTAVIALAIAVAGCHSPPPAMPALAAAAAPADAEPIPGGVAAPDGELYVQRAGGIDALDPDTGAVRWTTSAAAVPLVARADVVFALAAASDGGGAWSGPAKLVAIDRAAPHAARTGPPFDLPLELRRVLDARADGAAIAAWWQAEGVARRLREPPPPALGSLRIAVADGAAAADERGWVPDAVAAALAGRSTWAPPGRAADPWRAGDGWSAIAIDGGTPTLHHWPAAGGERTAVVLDREYLSWSAVEHVDRRHLFLRVCEPGAPPRCELRVLDAATGAPIAALADPPPPAPRPAPPFALRGRTLLAVASGALIAVDVDGGGERWRRPHLAPPDREPPP